MNAIQYIDLHTHADTFPEGVLGVRSFHQQEKEKLAGWPGFCSAGLHPWYLEEENLDADLDWLAETGRYPKVKMIGEAGLDRLHGPPLEVQEEIFRKQIHLAEQLRKPVIIHCVRAFPELIRIRKEQHASVPMIVHGYNKKPSLMRDLVKHGFYLSFGAALLRGNSSASGSLAEVPADRFFLETDDSGEDIRKIYKAAAGLRKVSLTSLAGQVRQNAENILGRLP